jgi:hypothetical protein
MLRMQRTGIPVCVTVSHLDGLVVARSAFRHSLNYRSVMVFGTAMAVADDAEKEAGLNAFIERLYPGRTELMRAILPQELKATNLIGMTIEEASAKIRNDGPLDLEADYGANCWAGTIPIELCIGAPDRMRGCRREARPSKKSVSSPKTPGSTGSFYRSLKEPRPWGLLMGSTFRR